MVFLPSLIRGWRLSSTESACAEFEATTPSTILDAKGIVGGVDRLVDASPPSSWNSLRQQLYGIRHAWPRGTLLFLHELNVSGHKRIVGVTAVVEAASEEELIVRFEGVVVNSSPANGELKLRVLPYIAVLPTSVMPPCRHITIGLGRVMAADASRFAAPVTIDGRAYSLQGVLEPSDEIQLELLPRSLTGAE